MSEEIESITLEESIEPFAKNTRQESLTERNRPPHPDKTRDKIITMLLWGVLIIIGIPLITYLAFPFALNEKILDYVKWVISVILPLFGTAVGFYFGRKSKEAEDPG